MPSKMTTCWHLKEECLEFDVDENQNKGCILHCSKSVNMNPISPSNLTTSKSDDTEHDYGLLKTQKNDVNEKKVPKAVENKFTAAVSDEDEDSEDSDSDLDNKTEGNSYEKMINKKRTQTKALLKSLEIDQIKEDISDAIVGIKKMKRETREIRKENKKVKYPPSRRSKRLVNFDFDFSEDALATLALRHAKQAAFEATQRQNKIGRKLKNTRANDKIRRVPMVGYEDDKRIPRNLTFKTALNRSNSYEECIRDLHISNSISDEKFVSYDRDVFKNMKLNECNVYKVFPTRITSAAWYPSEEDLIIAAGDKLGNLGLWKIKDSKTTPYIFKIHDSDICNMQFSLSYPAHLITSSYDGTMQCCDLVKHTFKEIYATDQFHITSFDFLSPSAFLISLSSGEVAVFDKKTNGSTSEMRHACHDSTNKFVSVHSVNKNVFVTTDDRNSIRLWDLRKLQEQPVLEILHHEKMVNSAYFSPVTGNSLLTTSLDDRICIFDCTALTEDIKLKATINHARHTWIFSAIWLPNSDDVFAVGCVENPKRIQIYDKDLNLFHEMIDDKLRTVTYIHRFHPYRNAIAGGNAYGLLYVFT